MLEKREIPALTRSKQEASPALMPRRDRRGGESGNSFEQVFPAHEFSELVRLGIALAHLVIWFRRRASLTGKKMDRRLANPCKPLLHPCAPDAII